MRAFTSPLRISLRLAPHRRLSTTSPLDPPSSPRLRGWRAAATLCLGRCKAADGLMWLPYSLGRRGGRGGVDVSFARKLACVARLLCVCGRTPMQAGSGAPLSPTPRQSVLLHVVLTVCACSEQQQQQKTHTTPEQSPLHYTHRLGRTCSSVQFFVSRAIPLLASEASFLLYPISPSLCAGVVLFLCSCLFVGNRLAHDWPCPGVLGVSGRVTVHGTYRRSGV